MSRIRTIKPEFWSSEQIVECSPTARLLFIGMWNFCDDGGVIPASVKAIKMQVFPGDDFNTESIKSWLNELVNNNLLTVFESNGKQYYFVTGWKHQKIDKPSYKYPQYKQNSTTIRLPFDEQTPAEGKGKEGKGCIGDIESTPFIIFDPKVLFDEMNQETFRLSVVTSSYAKGISEDEFAKYLQTYIEIQRDTNNLNRSIKDYRDHFIKWLRIELKNYQPAKKLKYVE